MESRWERGNAMSSLLWALHQLVFRRIPSQESDLVSELCKFRRDTQRKHVDSDANGLLTSRSLAWDTNSSILWSLTASKTYLQKPMHPRRLSLLPCVQKALAGLTSRGTTKLCMWSQKFQYPDILYNIYTVKVDIVMILWVFLGLAPSTWTLANSSYSSGEIVPYQYYQYRFYPPYWLKSRTTWDAWNLLTY